MAAVSRVYDEVKSHAMRLGIAEQVRTHEPKNAPPAPSIAVWIQSIRPVARASGLDATSGRLVFFVRFYQNMLAEPQDEIDPRITAGVLALMDSYSGDFTLGGEVRNVDLLGGADGAGLQADAGYINQDGKLMRVMTITLPIVINDLFTQAPERS